MTIKFQVTQEDIERGKKGPWCPIELALRRENHKAIVGYVHIKLDNLPYFPVPYELYRWIIDYDNYQPVKPFEYTLEVPDDTNSL